VTVQKISLTLMGCIRCGSENIDKEGYLYKQPVGMTILLYKSLP